MKRIHPVLGVGLLLISQQLIAHHGDAGRFEDELTTFTATVVALQLINPHSSLVVDVKDDSGNVVRWQVELEGPQRLLRDFGWNKNTIRPGQEVIVTGRRIKSGAPHINLTDRARIIVVEGCKEIYRSRDLAQDPATSSCS